MKSSKKAIIFQGGWDGHEPELVAARFKRMLEKNGYSCEVFDHQEVLADTEFLAGLDLIVPCWTMGEIKPEYVTNISRSVSGGTGLAGCHGGMCDAFRNDVEWQFMTGGQWVSHPGGDGIEYKVHIHNGSSPIVQGLEDFMVVSEHYYLHVDPAIEVLATTDFPLVNYQHISNKAVQMPVAWTKFWGNGRVYYCALGHHDDVFGKFPAAGELMERGLVWAAAGKQFALDHQLTTERFENSAKMY